MARTRIENGVLLDGNGGEPQRNAAVVLEDTYIVFAGALADYAPQAEETVIDAQGGTIMPGMIDSHVHMMMEHKPVDEKLATPSCR